MVTGAAGETVGQAAREQGNGQGHRPPNSRGGGLISKANQSPESWLLWDSKQNSFLWIPPAKVNGAIQSPAQEKTVLQPGGEGPQRQTGRAERQQLEGSLKVTGGS